MRPHGITIKGVSGSTGLVNNTRSNSTMAELMYEWNIWDTQTMVFLSFMLQLFLLGTGNLRRHNTNGVLRALIWLAYVGADVVAVYALGLFSQHEGKYKLGKESFGDILPFLWVPFLIVHLGGQDSITAFSIEDNNLWLRHLLNLGTQGGLALYVLWKSFHRISYSILIPAMLVFVSGIIKYGERVWALKCASRNGLAESIKFKSPVHNNRKEVYPSKESYALQIVLLARGLFVGRTVLQLGDGVGEKFIYSFRRYEQGKVNMVVTELGMMFDLLYTKANVLQRWTGVLFRCASQILMVVAFLLFLLTSEKAARHNKVNVALTYTLFSGAIFMEACSVVVVMASPWTRAHLREGSFLHGLCNSATSVFMAVQSNKRHQSWSSTSIGMGQFNLMDYSMAMKYNPTIISKAICAIGLDKQWRNLWYVYHIHDASSAGEGIISGVMEILGRPTGEWFGRSCFSRELNYTLSLPFEHALYRLHLYTELHISRYFDCTNSNVIPAPDDVTIMRLKEECETLSNHMMYLMVVRPSMLPVSTVAEYLEPELLKRVSASINGHEGAWTKLKFLDEYTSWRRKDLRGRYEEHPTNFPFVPEPNLPSELEQSLKDIKEMWLRLLMYAAGKCRGELHARQLGEGGELITFVWLLMLHHGIGDLARDTELSLCTSNYFLPVQAESVVSVGNNSGTPRHQRTCYAFNFT